MKKYLYAIGMTITLATTGCANMDNQYSQNGQYQTIADVKHAKVINVREFSVEENNPNYAMGALGGVVGAILGNQVGKGSGNTIATIGGGAAGIYLGSKYGGNKKIITMVELTLKENNGQNFIVTQRKNANYYVGQKVIVRVQGNEAHVE